MWRVRRLKGTAVESHLFCIEDQKGNIYKYPLNATLRFNGFDNAETACLLLDHSGLTDPTDPEIYETVEPYTVPLGGKRVRLHIDMTKEEALMHELNNKATEEGVTVHDVIKNALRGCFIRELNDAI